MNIYKKLLVTSLILYSGYQVHAQAVLNASDAKINIATGTKVNINGGIQWNGTSGLNNNGTIALSRNAAISSVSENWEDNTAGGLSGGVGEVKFNSDREQQIKGLTKFSTLSIDNGAGVIQSGSIEVSNTLNLDNGTLKNSGSDVLFVSNPATNAIQSASSYANSFVAGKISRATNATSEYLFPVGKELTGTGMLYAPVKLEKSNANATNFTVEYFPVAPVDNTNASAPLNHVSKLEYWNISSNITSGTDDDAKLSLSWRTLSNVSTDASDRNSLLVAQYTGTNWKSADGGISANVVGEDENSGYVTTLAAVTDFSATNFTLGSTSSNNVLPVTFVSFEAKASSELGLSYANLLWHTASERNNAYFEIQRSQNGKDWVTVTEVDSKAIDGNSNTILNYSYKDEITALSGNIYYKLKQVDKNGDFYYTEIKTVNLQQESVAFVSVYPNPVRASGFNLKLAGSTGENTEVKVVSGNGKIVYSRLLELKEGINDVSISDFEQPAGVYVLQVAVSDKLQFVKFIKVDN